MLAFEGVSFAYSGAAPPLFADLSLVLSEGRTTAIMGPSGCGKTTLLKLACGLLSPTAGTVRRGEALVQLGSVRGLVFHEDTLLPWLTVLDNVLIVAEGQIGAREQADHLLGQFGLREAADFHPYQLSEGM